MDKSHKHSLETKFYEEIADLLKYEAYLKKYTVGILTPSTVKLYKKLSNDNEYAIFIISHDLMYKYGIDENVFIIEIQIKDPQEKILYKMNIIVRNNSSKDEVLKEEIINSEDVIDITSEMLYDDIVELIDLCKIKKEKDDIERKYKRMMNVLEHLND